MRFGKPAIWIVSVGFLAGVGTVAMPFGFAQAETKLRLATYVKENDIRVEGFKHFAELVAQKTEGRVTVEVYPGGTLHPFKKAIDSLLGGVSDISPVVGGAVDKRLPCTNVTHFMPAAIDLNRVIELDNAYNELMKDEFEKLGLVVVLPQNSSYDQRWYFRKELNDLEKMDGLLVRSFGPMVSNIIQDWGGKPVYMSPNEVYQGAERGVVSGATMGFGTYSAWSMWDVLPYMANVKMMYGQNMYTMSKKKFDSLSASDQKSLLEAGQESAQWLEPKYQAWINAQVGRGIMENDMRVISFSQDQRKALVASALKGWSGKIEEACGVERTKKLNALLNEFSG
tara:strand:+ start:3508 stop:4527 length:1020 start_codon:yes stop_codon:yes gene_type:complete